MFLQRGHIRTHVIRTTLAIFIALIVLTGLPSGLVWADDGEKGNGSSLGLGFASYLATLPYGAIKIAYAGLGAIIGCFTYALTGGNEDAADTIWSSSMLGTYVLTPEHLTGEEPIRFIGP